MQQSLSSLFVATLVVPTLATKLLLPLYQYPLDGSWDDVYSTIEANPNLGFQIILNVDCGPGDGSAPNSDFATGTARLNSYSNVETLGYVHTLFGDASQEEVIQNVTAWAAWNAYTGANTAIKGIFFDEIHNEEGSTTDVTYVQALVEAASSAFGTYAFTSMLNPGSKPEHLEYYDIANYVVVFETVASDYTDSVLTENIPTGYANQSAILIPDFASAGTASEAQSWLQSMVAAGVGSAHILDYDYIQATTADQPAALGSIASALADLQVGSGTGSSSSSSSSSAVVAVSVAETTPVAALPTTTTVIVSPEEPSTVDAPEPTSTITSQTTTLTTINLPVTTTVIVGATSPSDDAASSSPTTTAHSGHHGHGHHHRRLVSNNKKYA